MASINLGVVGCIAAANAGNPPTAVSIAENASSGQNNAFKTYEINNIESHFDVDYSDWSGSTTESYGVQYEPSEISPGDMSDYETPGQILIYSYAYLRATGATSYSWSGSVYSSSFSTYAGASASASIVGSSSNSQDSTGGLFGTGIGLRILPGSGSGRGGGTIPVWPRDGDSVIFKLTGTATNSDGSTSSDLYIKYSWAEGQ